MDQSGPWSRRISGTRVRQLQWTVVSGRRSTHAFICALCEICRRRRHLRRVNFAVSREPGEQPWLGFGPKPPNPRHLAAKKRRGVIGQCGRRRSAYRRSGGWLRSCSSPSRGLGDQPAARKISAAAIAALRICGSTLDHFAPLGGKLPWLGLGIRTEVPGFRDTGLDPERASHRQVWASEWRQANKGRGMMTGLRPGGNDDRAYAPEGRCGAFFCLTPGSAMILYP